MDVAEDILQSPLAVENLLLESTEDSDVDNIGVPTQCYSNTVSDTDVEMEKPPNSDGDDDESDGDEDSEHEDDDEDDDEDEDENDEDDALSEGGNLAEEFWDALPSNSETAGSYYYAETLEDAPNPCLDITGIGLVGLPLSERDARAIISCASLAPFGHGERTVVDKNVRDTWEIEPNRITFRNPQFLARLQSQVLADITKALGVTPSAIPRVLELYKLLLYETGSHFLPHQDTAKSEGKFATVVVILPSVYTGGEVHVTHGSETKVIDFASTSLLSTSVLAWYTDVKHEVKSIASGYRLALSFNLIQPPSPRDPIPRLPDSSAQDPLRHVFRKWNQSLFDDMPDDDFLVCMLDHQYSIAERKRGLKCLKGHDSHLVRIVQNVAEGEGFTLFLAALVQHQAGEADGDDYGYSEYRSRRWGCYSDYDEDDSMDGGTVTMGEVSYTTNTLSDITDLQGRPLVGDSSGSITILDDERCFVPADPFEGKVPDKTEYEGYMGNGAGGFDQWYHRTAVVVLPNSHVDELCFKSGGLSYAIDRLQKPNAGDRFTAHSSWVDRIMDRRAEWKAGHMASMYAFALQCQSPELWHSVVQSPLVTVATLHDISQPLKLFGFPTVRLCLEMVLARSTKLGERIEFIQRVPTHASEEEKGVIQIWMKTEITKVLSSYPVPKVDDISDIISLLRGDLASEVEATFFSKLLEKKGTYTFLATLIKRLDALVQELAPKKDDQPATESTTVLSATDAPVATHPPSQPPTTHWEVVRNIDRRCFDRLQQLWDDLSDVNTFDGTPIYLDRVVKIVSQCITRKQVESCTLLIIDILKKIPPTAANIRHFHGTLCTHLFAVLKTHHIPPSSSPFVDLFQIVIGAYLRDVLGKKHTSAPLSIRRVGCPPSARHCDDCNEVNRFLNDPSRNSMTSYWAVKRRQHIDMHLQSARDMCTLAHMTISARKTATTITKSKTLTDASKALIEARGWTQKQAFAKTFLQQLGGEAVLKEIMKERWIDVVAALNGERWFGESCAAPPRTIVPPAFHQLPATQVPLPQGTKRKGPSLQPGPSGSATRSADVDSSSGNSLEAAMYSALAADPPATSSGETLRILPMPIPTRRTKQTARKNTHGTTTRLAPTVNSALTVGQPSTSTSVEDMSTPIPAGRTKQTARKSTGRAAQPGPVIESAQPSTSSAVTVLPQLTAPTTFRTKQTARKTTRSVIQLGSVIDLTLEDSD